MDFLRLLLGFMGLILIVIEGIYWRNWLACLVGGTCRGASGETSTSPIFLVKDRVKRFCPTMMDFSNFIFE
jgi:hypothetical protein